MPLFRKKPVVVKAHQWDGTTLQDRNLWATSTGFPVWDIGSRNGKTGMIIPTLEGDMLAERGDWIIWGVNGEYYPCKPDVFVKTYELVE